MNILTIAIKDLKQIMRDRMSALFLLIMPLAFTFLMGMFVGGAQQPDNRLPVGVINNDPQGSLTILLLDTLNKSNTIKLVDLTPADAAKISSQINSGRLAAGLIIPENYSSLLLAGIDTSLELTADSFNSGGQTALSAVQASVTQLTGSVEAARLALQEAQKQTTISDPNAFLLAAVQKAQAAWQDPQVTISTQPVSAESNPGGFSGYVQTSPGMMVQFTIAGLIGAAAVLVHERKNRTTSRMLTAPVTRVEIILGHLLGIMLTVLAQEAVLILAGQLIFKINYLRQPLAILIMMVAMALFCGSLGLFFGAISRREEHAIMWPLIAMFVLTALGGAWFPLDVTSKTFYTIGHFMPTAWAMDGFQNIILRGLGLSSVLLPAAILLGFAVVFFALAVWQMKWE